MPKFRFVIVRTCFSPSCIFVARPGLTGVGIATRIAGRRLLSRYLCVSVHNDRRRMVYIRIPSSLPDPLASRNPPSMNSALCYRRPGFLGSKYFTTRSPSVRERSRTIARIDFHSSSRGLSPSLPLGSITRNSELSS